MTNEFLTNIDIDSSLWQNSLVSNNSLLSRAPLSGANSYYRPKAFTASIAVNPLVTAASALLFLASRLRANFIYKDIHTLYQDLVHEVKAFEFLAQNQGYRSETILVARYILCSTLDEIILHTNWGEHSNWHMHKLLATFQKDSWGGERFFLILERISEDTALHIDLLELIYLCLSLGFKGKYRQEERGEFLLEEIRENLYQIIENQRGEHRKELCELPPKKLASLPINNHLPVWLIGIMTLSLLATIYIGFNVLFDISITHLAHELQQLLPGK